jgi:hypothetical protein
MLPEYTGDATTRNWSVFFWIGLIGIIATGLMVGMGGDKYWALSKVGGIFGEPSVSLRGPLLFFSGAVLVGLFDLSALCVVFAGGVLVVQGLRGRI